MPEYKVFEIPDGWVVRKISKGGRLMETVAIFPGWNAKERALEYKDFCDRRMVSDASSHLPLQRANSASNE